MDDRMATDKFKDVLMQDEDILWSGKPNESIIFTMSDFLNIPFSLLLGGASMFVVLSVFEDVLSNGAKNILDVLSLAVGGLLAFTVLYSIFGRFVYKRIKKRNTYYAVTSQVQ